MGGMIGGVVGGVMSGIGAITTGAVGASQQEKASEYAEKARQMALGNLNGLQGLYGDFVTNQSKYIQNLTGESFASPAIQQLKVENQRNTLKRENDLVRTGVGDSAYALQASEASRQQEAETIAQTTWQAEQQAQSMKQAEAERGMGLIQNALGGAIGATNNSASLYENRAQKNFQTSNELYKDTTAYAAEAAGAKTREKSSSGSGTARSLDDFSIGSIYSK